MSKETFHTILIKGLKTRPEFAGFVQSYHILNITDLLGLSSALVQYAQVTSLPDSSISGGTPQLELAAGAYRDESTIRLVVGRNARCTIGCSAFIVTAPKKLGWGYSSFAELAVCPHNKVVLLVIVQAVHGDALSIGGGRLHHKLAAVKIATLSLPPPNALVSGKPAFIPYPRNLDFNDLNEETSIHSIAAALDESIMTFVDSLVPQKILPNRDAVPDHFHASLFDYVSNPEEWPTQVTPGPTALLGELAEEEGDTWQDVLAQVANQLK
eukprot:gene21994-29052_t